MTKFEQQAADLAAIYLYKEGLFVRAYNEGAYAFIHQVLDCKPMRRFVKSAVIIGDRPRFSIGVLQCRVMLLRQCGA